MTGKLARFVAPLIAAAVAAFGIAGFTLAQAPDLLLNGDFDSDTANWGHPDLWSERDSRGDPDSGSGMSINSSALAGGSVEFDLEQCVPVQPGGRYRLGAEAYVPSGQQRSPYPALAVFWFTNATCEGLGTPFGNPVQFRDFPTNTWLPVVTHVNVPAGMTYARVMLGTGRGAGDAVAPFAVVHFDGVRFLRVDHLTSRVFLPFVVSE